MCLPHKICVIEAENRVDRAVWIFFVAPLWKSLLAIVWKSLEKCVEFLCMYVVSSYSTAPP